MGNCQTSGLKELFEEITSNESKQPDAIPVSNGTPDRMMLIDPRSPLVDAERTPIEVVLKPSALAQVSDEAGEETTDDTRHHKRQLDDPRSATAGIRRTPILVESPLNVNTDDAEPTVEESPDVKDGPALPKPAASDTPVLVCDMPQKVIAVAKKLTFDVSPSPRKVKTAEFTSTARGRLPLAHVQPNTPTGPRDSRRSSAKSKGKPQGPMSPLHLLHLRQRLAVKRALQLTQAQAEAGAENCPPVAVEGASCKPIKVSAPPALAAKDPSLRI